jgi:ferric iron reductase protein FhuF
MSTKRNLQPTNRCTTCENNTSILNYIGYLRTYQTLLANYLDKGMEEFSTMKYRKKKTSMLFEDYYISIEVMHHDNKMRIREEIKYVNQIIKGYEKFRGSN